MSRKASELPLEQSEQLIRQQLDRILAGQTFQQVNRLRRFLSFVVLESLAGRREELKEYVVGIQVFGKEASFDPRADPVVRVQARRLRARLVRYYGEEGHSDDVLIDLPKGGYAPVFSRREASVATRPALAPAILNRNSVRVLAFADHSASGGFGYFCQGIRDEIIHRLTGLVWLRVVEERASGVEHAGPLDSPPEAAVLITGSLRHAGDTLRVTTNFVDGANGCYLWSASLDGTPAEGLAFQERIAEAVAAKLRADGGELSTGIGRVTTAVNLTAHNLYLQGRYHLSQRTEEGMRKAVEFFERALAEDPQYGLAHSGLSDACALLMHYGVAPPADMWTRIVSSAATAVMLDGNSAEARTSLAHAKGAQEWDFQGAEQEFQRAIQLNPRYATAHHWYATSALVPLGRLDDALERLLVAQALDPVSAIIARDVALGYYYRREFDAALEQCDNAIELNPHFPPAYLTLAAIQEYRGDLDESAAAVERAVRLAPRSPRAIRTQIRICAITDKRRQAFKLLHNLETLANERYVSPFDLAVAHFVLGQMEESVDHLVKACDGRCFDLISIKAELTLDEFRDHPRLSTIIDRVGAMDPVTARPERV